MYLDLIRCTPFFTDVNDSRLDRVGRRCAAPALVTPTNSGGGRRVHHRGAQQRRRRALGARPYRRRSTSDQTGTGSDADPQIVSALEMTYYGARFVHAGSGDADLPPSRRPDGLCRRSDLREKELMAASTGERPVELVPIPTTTLFHEDPYPYYKRLRDEVPPHRNEEQNFWR